LEDSLSEETLSLFIYKRLLSIIIIISFKNREREANPSPLKG